MNDRQELIRRFAVALAGRAHISEYLRREIAHDMIWRIAECLADAEPPQPPADDRIERALQVLRNVQTYDCHSGDALGGMKVCRHNAGDWVESEVLSEVRRILEGKGNG